MLKVMSGDDAHPLRIVSLPVTIGRPTNSSGLTANPNNGFFTNSLLSRKHAMISMQNKHVLNPVMLSLFIIGVALDNRSWIE